MKVFRCRAGAVLPVACCPDAVCLRARYCRGELRIPCCPDGFCAKLSLFCAERSEAAPLPGAPGVFQDTVRVPTGLVFEIPDGFRGFVEAPCGPLDPDRRTLRSPVVNGQELEVWVQNVGGVGPVVLEAGVEVGALNLVRSAALGVLEVVPVSPA